MATETQTASRANAVAIVTGGSVGVGREVARQLAGWGWAIVVVYLEDQPAAEATVAEILASDGKVVTVRADLADDLDVQRLFSESAAVFAGVDVVVHTTTDDPSILYQYAARLIRPQGALVSVPAVDHMTPGLAGRLHDRGISVGRGPPQELLGFLAQWRRKLVG